MGMFDTIEVRVPLPDGWDPTGKELQSKSLDCLLDHYTITEGGLLLRREGWLRQENPWLDPVEEIVPFHGDIVFYGTEDYPRIDSTWHEYVARFTDGRLVGIEVKPDPWGDSS